MPNNLTQLAVGVALAAALAAVSIAAVGSATAQSTAEQSKAISRDANRPETPVSETEPWLGDRQQLRGILLNSSHERLR